MPKGHYLVPWASLALSHLFEWYHLAPALLGRVGRLRGCRCRGRFHEAADFLSSASLHIVGDMGVGVQGKARAVVTQHTGQGLYIHTAGDCHGSECVSEVVEAHMLFDVCVFQQFPVDPRLGIRTPVTACAVRRKQDGIVRMLSTLLDEQIHCLLQRRMQHHVDTPDEGAKQSFVGLLLRALTRPLDLDSLYILWMWIEVSSLSFTAPIAGTMWFSMMFSS